MLSVLSMSICGDRETVSSCTDLFEHASLNINNKLVNMTSEELPDGISYNDEKKKTAKRSIRKSSGASTSSASSKKAADANDMV